jgi:hypothetical protein
LPPTNSIALQTLNYETPKLLTANVCELQGRKKERISATGRKTTHQLSAMNNVSYFQTKSGLNHGLKPFQIICYVEYKLNQ